MGAILLLGARYHLVQSQSRSKAARGRTESRGVAATGVEPALSGPLTLPSPPRTGARETYYGHFGSRSTCYEGLMGKGQS